MILMAAAAEVHKEDWDLKVLMGLCGIITLLLSILLGGFVKHISEHSKYQREITSDFDGKCGRLFDLLEEGQTKEACKEIHSHTMQMMNTKLESIEKILTKKIF